MQEFDTFKELFQKLTVNEKKHLKFILTPKKGIDSYDNDIFKYASSNDNMTLSDIEMLFKNERNHDAIRKQLDRLTDKIYDVLINRDQILNNTVYDNRAKDVFQLIRLIMISDVLTYRGLLNLSEKLIDKVIRQAEYYEHFDILVYALVKKMNKKYLDPNKMKEIEHQILLVQKSSFILHKVLNIHWKYASINSVKLRANAILNLSVDYNEIYKSSLDTHSSLIKLYLKFIQLQYCYLHFNINQGLIKSDELLDFLKDYPGIKSKSRIFNAHLFKELFYRLDFSFETASGVMESSKKYFIANPINTFIFLDRMFLSTYYLSDLYKASYYLKQMDGLKAAFNSQKLTYYNLVIKFLKDNDLVGKVDWTYSNDSNGSYYNIYVRILYIMSLMESKKFDLSESQIEALRKYLTKKDFRQILPKRIQLHLKLLMACNSESYDYNKVINKSVKYLLELENSENSWHPDSYELIIFEEWLLSKAQGKDYNHGEIMAKMKRKYMDRKSASSLMLA